MNPTLEEMRSAYTRALLSNTIDKNMSFEDFVSITYGQDALKSVQEDNSKYDLFMQADYVPQTDISKLDPTSINTGIPNLQQTTTPVNTDSNKSLSKLDLLNEIFSTPLVSSGLPLGVDDRFFAAGLAAGYDPTRAYGEENQKLARRGKNAALIGGIGSGLLGAARNFLSGYGIQKRGSEVMKDYYSNQAELNRKEYQYTPRKDGGKINLFENGGMLSLKPEEIAIDEYIAALPEQMEEMANAEIEKDEYIIRPDNVVNKVVGETHEKGGVKQFLEDGTKIVSDNLKIGKDVANVIFDKTGLKVKATDTYAETIDKYSKQIGLDKLNEEAQNMHKKMREVSQIKDAITRDINMSFLKEELDEIEVKRQDLLQKRLDFSNKIYKAQESSKEVPQYRSGGMHSSPEFKAMCKKYGITEEEGLMALKKLENGGTTTQEKYPDGGKKEIEKIFNEYKTTPDYKYKFEGEDLKAMRDRLKQAALEWGVDVDGNKIDNAGKEELNAIAAEMQNKVSPNVAKDFGLRIAPTKTGLEYLSTLSEEELNKIVPDKNLITKIKEAKSGSFKALSDDERNRLTTYIQDGKDNLPADYAEKNFKDREWFFRYPSVKEVVFTNQDEYNQYLQENIPNNLGDNIIKTDKEGLYIKPIFKPSENTTPPTTQQEGVKNYPTDPLVIDEYKKRSSTLIAPTPYNLPPDALIPHAKREYRPEFIDPTAISADEAKAEIFRAQEVGLDVLNDIPLGLRGAYTATTTANTANQVSKAITDVNRYNAQNRQQTEQANVAISNQDELYRYQEIPRYEELALTALEKTKANINEYFNAQERNRLNKYNYLTQANLIDSLFEDVRFDGNGVVVDTNKKLTTHK